MTDPADLAALVEQSRLAREHTARARAHTRQLVADSQRRCQLSRLLLTGRTPARA